MEDVLKDVRRIVRLNNTKGKIVNAMALLSHVIAEILGHTRIDVKEAEYASIISTLQEWQNKIETEESEILAKVATIDGWLKK